MKKLFVVALAALGMVACVNEDVVETPKSDVIAFAGLVDNATRAAVDPSTTKDNLTAFDVWAFMNEFDGTVFENEDVKLVGEAWDYTNIQYWTPLNKYYFAALAPMNSANVKNLVLATDDAAKLGLGEFDFTNVDGSEDLIYAKKMVETPEMSVLLAQGMPAVKLQFQHLLSKVKFTFENGFTTNNAYVEVNDIKMTAPKAAHIDLAVADYSKGWVLDGTNETYEFGDVAKLAKGAKDECTDERLSIPASADYVYEISFEVVLYMGNQEAYRVTKTSSLAGVEFEMGKAYNLVAAITPENLELKEIEFAVDVDAWDPYVGAEHKVGTVYVKDAAELQAALDGATAENSYSNIVVLGDILADVTATQKNGVHLTIDGNDHKFVGTLYLNGQSSLNTNKSLTIKNFNFETTDAARDFISCKTDAVRYARNITIEGCTFTGSGNTSDVVVLNLRQIYNLLVKDCVATDVHSLGQITASNDMIFEGVTVNAGRGLNFQTAAHGVVEVNNCNITATKGDGYGIRVQAIADKTLTVNNSTITAYEPIVLRGASKKFTLYVNGSELNEVGESEIVIAGETPAIYIDGLLYGGQKKNVKVETVAELKAALEDTAAAVIELAEGEYDLDDKIYYLNGGEKLIKAAAGSNTVVKGKLVANADLTVANVKFAANAMSTTNLNSSTYGTYVIGGYSAIVTVNKVAALFEACEFDGGDDYVVAINYFGDEAGKVLNVNNCAFNQTYIYSKVLCNITNNTFTLNGCPYALCVWPRPAGTTNSVCAFTGNTITSNYNAGRAHCQVMLLSQSTPYANVEFNVQNNNGAFVYTYAWANAATFDMSTITFAEGSKTFSR